MSNKKIEINSDSLIKSFTEISEALLDAPLEPTLEKIADNALEVMGADVVSILRFDSTTKRNLVSYTISGDLLATGFGESEKTSLDDNFLINLLEKNKSFWSESISDLPNQSANGNKSLVVPQLNSGFWSREGFKSIAAVSLTNKEKPLGAIFFNYRDQKSFDIDSKKMVEAFAKYCSTAINNADILKSNELHWKANMQLAKPLIEGMFLSSMLHNSNNILQALLLKFSRFSQNIEYATNSRTALRRTMEFVNEMREPLRELSVDFKKLENYWRGGEESRKLPQPIANLVEEAIDVVSNRLMSRRVAIDLRRNTSSKVNCDANEIKHVLVNILINAAQAIEKRGNIYIEVFDKSTKYVAIRITDDGPGIDQSIGDEIFRPYFTTKQDGTGLGLPISKHLVENHGGSLEFRSSKTRGTSFEVSLPIYSEEEETLQKPSKRDRTVQKTSLLLVEDNKYIRDELTSLLKERYNQIDIISPSSLQELDLALDSDHIDNALIDINLTAWPSRPTVSSKENRYSFENGIQLAKLLQDRDSNTKLAIYSSYLGSPKIQDELKSLTGVIIINKSFDIDSDDLLTPFKDFLKKLD